MCAVTKLKTLEFCLCLLLLDLDKQSANMKKAAAWSKKENTNN